MSFEVTVDLCDVVEGMRPSWVVDVWVPQAPQMPDQVLSIQVQGEDGVEDMHVSVDEHDGPPLVALRDTHGTVVAEWRPGESRIGYDDRFDADWPLIEHRTMERSLVCVFLAAVAVYRDHRVGESLKKGGDGW